MKFRLTRFLFLSRSLSLYLFQGRVLFSEGKSTTKVCAIPADVVRTNMREHIYHWQTKRITTHFSQRSFCLYAFGTCVGFVSVSVPSAIAKDMGCDAITNSLVQYKQVRTVVWSRWSEKQRTHKRNTTRIENEKKKKKKGKKRKQIGEWCLFMPFSLFQCVRSGFVSFGEKNYTKIPMKWTAQTWTYDSRLLLIKTKHISHRNEWVCVCYSYYSAKAKYG